MASVVQFAARLLLLAVIVAVACAKTARVPPHFAKQVHRVETVHRRDVEVQPLTHGHPMAKGPRVHRVTFRVFDHVLHLLVWNDNERYKNVKVYGVDEHGRQHRRPLHHEHYYTGIIEGDHNSHVFLYMHETDMDGNAETGSGEKYSFERAGPHYFDFELEADEEQPDLFVYRMSDINQENNPLNQQTRPYCTAGSYGQPHDHDHDHDHDHGHGQDQDHKHDGQQRLHGQPQHNHAQTDTSAEETHGLHGATAVHVRSRRALTPNDVSNRTCKMRIDADFSFFQSNGGYNPSLSVMFRHIDTTDRIISKTTFGSIVNVNLRVTFVKIYETINNPFNGSFASVAGVQNLLDEYSKGNYNDFCLAHLFVSKNMASNTLGLANVGSTNLGTTGGICELNQGGVSKNTAWTTNTNSGTRLASVLNELVTAHEIGHGFGSSHDFTAACTPGGSAGNFLMNAIAVDGNSPNNNDFSTCSRSSISDVMLVNAVCFVLTSTDTCNNGLLNVGEACDPGFLNDTCCGNCKLKTGANCSSLNTCCTESCGLNATKPCYTEFLGDPSCRANTNCGLVDSSGNAVTGPGAFENGTGIFIPTLGNNGTVGCPRNNFKPDGAPCGQGGRCAGSPNTRCKGFCEFYGAIACTCSGSSQCSVCCQHNDSVTANDPSLCFTPFRDFNSSGTYQCVAATSVVTEARVQTAACYAFNASSPTTTRYSDNPNLDPACTSSCTKVLFLAANTPCDGGLCDVNGACSSSTSSFSLNSVSISSIQDWARDNIVGAVMIGAFLIWCPCGILIHRADKKERAKNINYGKRVTGGTMVRRESRRRASQQQRTPGRQPVPGRAQNSYGVSRF